MFTLNSYRRLISIQVRSQLQYRVAFLLEFGATALGNFTFFMAIALVLQRFGSLGGWTLGEIAFLWGMVELSFGLMDMIFSGFDPGDFGQRVRQGTFDQLLLRPLNITVQVLGSQFTLRRLGRIFQGVIILAFAFSLLELHLTPAKALYLPLVILGQVCFFGGLFMIGATITFWTVESIEAMNIFTYGGSELMAYPMNIYPDWLRYFFTLVIPAAFLNYYPALFLLDKPDPFNLPRLFQFIAPLVGAAVLLLALWFWRFGIRHYQSTGS